MYTNHNEHRAEKEYVIYCSRWAGNLEHAVWKTTAWHASLHVTLQSFLCWLFVDSCLFDRIKSLKYFTLCKQEASILLYFVFLSGPLQTPAVFDVDSQNWSNIIAQHFKSGFGGSKMFVKHQSIMTHTNDILVITSVYKGCAVATWQLNGVLLCDVFIIRQHKIWLNVTPMNEIRV